MPLLRRQHHGHLAPFHQGFGLDLGDRRGLGPHALQEPEADILVRHFAAAKAQRHLDLVAFVEETADRAHLHFVVVVVDARPQFDFLDLHHLLTLARLRGLFLLEKAVFAEIEDLADRRGRVGDDFDQVERGFFGEPLGVCEIDDAVIVSLGVNELNLYGANVAIGARALLSPAPRLLS